MENKLLDKLENYELKGLDKLESGLLIAVGKVAVERFFRSGQVPQIHSTMILDESISKEWQLKLTDNGVEVFVPTKIGV